MLNVNSMFFSVPQAAMYSQGNLSSRAEEQDKSWRTYQDILPRQS